MGLMRFLQPPAPSEALPKEQIDPAYKKLRMQVFLGIFLGYAGYYLIRKNFTMVVPDLVKEGHSKTELGFAMAAISISYGISKFLMATVSDRSNARIFLSLGLFLSSLVMISMAVFPFATSSIAVIFILLLIFGWFQGMGWPPCGRVVVHWFSVKERGTRMAIWNVAHNVGGGLMAVFATWGFYVFGSWEGKLLLPSIIALIVVVIIYVLVRDRPQACGLPPIEHYKNSYSKDYNESHEKSISTKKILLDYVLVNRMIWYIAFANAFIYLVRYGILDWAPVYLDEVKGFSLNKTGWAYFLFEWAGIPGTLLCGWLSDKIFKGRRAPATIIYMLLVAIAVLVYWKSPASSPMISIIALIAIGFLIYGPVMLIGVHALDLVPKNAAGTAAGLTGFFGYFGGALFANAAIGYIVDHYSWDMSFIVMIAACLIAIFFTSLTWKKEQNVSNHS